MYKHIFASSPWRFHQSPPPTKLFGSSRSVSCQESLRRHACRTIPFQGLAVQRGVLPLCGIHPNRYPAGLTPRQHISLLSPTAPRLLLAAPSAGAGQASTMQRARPYPFNVITASLRVTMTYVTMSSLLASPRSSPQYILRERCDSNGHGKSPLRHRSASRSCRWPSVGFHSDESEGT